MQLQEEHPVACPYCGEPITLLVDHTGGDQHYVEDCFVCCQPILVRVEVGAEVVVRVRREED